MLNKVYQPNLHYLQLLRRAKVAATVTGTIRPHPPNFDLKSYHSIPSRNPSTSYYKSSYLEDHNHNHCVECFKHQKLIDRSQFGVSCLSSSSQRRHHTTGTIASTAGVTREAPMTEKMEVLSMPKSLNDANAMVAFLQDIDAVMFDCDGVLWLGMNILPNAPDLVKKLRAMGKKVFFMTNNSTKTRDEFLAKFNTLGFEATLEEIVSTSYLAALYLKELQFNKKVYAIGTSGVTQELEAAKIEVLPVGPDVMPNVSNWAHGVVESIPLDPDVGAVVVGFDHHFSYTKLFKASTYLKNPNCIFIATNTDESFPAGDHKVIPGTGAIVFSVQTAAGRKPIIMGKPSQIPFDYVQRFHNLVSNRVLMVGDRANTDILFGRNCGLHTLLVLSGVTNLDEVQEWVNSGEESTKNCIPEFYLQDVNEFYQLVKNV